MSLSEKKELRKKMKAIRDALSIDERHKKSEQIAGMVVKLREFLDAEVVLLYSAIKSEVETNLIYETAQCYGKKIYYPRVLGDVMEFYLVDEGTEYETSPFGVCEPKINPNRRYTPNDADQVFVLMPGLAFDERGNRIGYGGGYYDKYLQELERWVNPECICKTAVAYGCQMVPVDVIFPDSYDIKPDYIVTEDGVIKV